MSTAGQTGRLIAVDTPLGPDKLLLLRYSGTERISAPFSFELELLSEEAIKFDDMVGKPATITVALPSGGRYINGVVSRFGQTGGDWNFRRYSAQIVPWFWLLTRYLGGRLAVFGFLTPLFGVMLGAVVLAEPLRPAFLLALAMVGLGIGLVNARR